MILGPESTTPNKVQDHGNDSDERRNRVVADFRLLAGSQMPPTSSAVWLLGEGETAAIVALQAGVCPLGFKRPRSRHGPSYE